MDLLEACEKGDLNRVKELIKAGADLDIKNIDGETPLYLAMINDHPKILEELAICGADLDIMINGQPLIMYLFDLDVLKILIDNGVNLDAASNSGRTALMAAVEENQLEIAQELIAVSSINAQDNYGKTALLVAVDYDSVDCVKILLEAGADVNIKTVYGDTPLKRIISKLEYDVDKENRTRILELLKQYGAKE